MRNVLLEVAFLFIVILASTGGSGCGDDVTRAAGAAGRGGSAGSVGTAGVGGNAAGTGGATVQSPEEIHDSLINAQTTGGVEVTRPRPTLTPPACQ